MRLRVGDRVKGITNLFERFDDCKIIDVDFRNPKQPYRVLMNDGSKQWCNEKDVELAINYKEKLKEFIDNHEDFNEYHIEQFYNGGYEIKVFPLIEEQKYTMYLDDLTKEQYIKINKIIGE